MSPPNTPLDPRMHAAILVAVREAMAQERELALGPIKQEIVTLRETDRRHSGTHAGLTEELRKSKPEIEEAVMRRVEGKLDALRAEMRTAPADAAQGKNAAVAALQASNNATQAAASAALDTAQIRSKQDDQARMAWVRMFLTVTVTPVLVAIVAAIASHF